ncbi:uncharacterized protein LOC131888084 isoform X1 [Tigriopus californicus]|uniref:uncharacterized protein LOC131888084 isoform X1 n=1 Tax=Tigriopus californicus TaxID=6832 RepID=UPI0027DA8916|nr:uncharacterized protein LOC131888084 isoform X1 [Tigriopus californicus]
MVWIPKDPHRCPACKKPVYPAEQIIATDRTPYHRVCVRCVACRCGLTPGTLTEKDGQLYCRMCYQKIMNPYENGDHPGMGQLSDEERYRMEQDDWLDILLKSPSQSFQRIILGLNCLQVRNAPTMLVIPMIHLFNQRSEDLPKLRLRNCLVHRVQNVLSVRSEFDPTTGQSFLDQLEPLEIKVIGGYILSGMEPSQIRSMADMHRRTKVLRAISEEPLSNLFRVLDISALKHFANLHLRDLTLMSTNVSGIDLGSLLYFLDLHHFQSNDQMVKSLVPRLKGPICTDESTFNDWSAILQILWNDKRTTTAAELYDLGDSIVLLPLTKIKEIDKDVLGFVAPYLFERSHYLKEFRYTEHEANIQFLGQCVTFLNKQGMDPRFIQLRVFHTLRYLETFTNRPKNGRFKRNLSERELDQVRRGFEAARAYWKYLHDNNFLTQDQKNKARVIFSNFVEEIAKEQRRLLNLNDSISNRDVSATLHNLITEGLLSESIEQEFHEFSDRLRVKVVHQVENVLKVNFAEPKYLPEGPLKTELQEIFGLHHEVTQATSTASPTKEIKPSSGSIERKLEIPFDLFEGLDHLLVDTMLDQLGPAAKKPKTASTLVNSGTSGEQTLPQSSKVHQEFISEAKMKATISRFKYSGDSIFLSESTLKAVDDSTVKEWDVERILANLDILGRTNELSTSTKSKLWNKVHADLIPGTILGSNTILNLGNLLQVVKTVKSISASMLFSQDFGFEAISELSSKLKNGAKIEFARQIDDLLVCQKAEQNNDHIKLLLASVQPIWCYLNSENLSEFFRNCPKVLQDLIALFPGMPLCSESQRETLLTFLNSTAKMFGPSSNWSSSDAASMGTIIGGLKSELLLKIPPTAWRGLTDFGYQQLEQNNDLALLPAQKEQIPLEFWEIP